MTGERPDDRLRAEAAGGDHHALARFAHALYKSGLGPREVLRECYGVEFPVEFFVISEAEPQLMFRFTILPWALARTPDRGGPPRTAALLDSLDRRVLDRDPDLIPLGLCLGVDDDIDFGLGGEFLCYRRSELAAGRSAVFSVAFDNTAESPITAWGDSLLEALHEHHAANAVWTGQERRRTAGHSGGSAFDDEDVAAANKCVTDIEALQREVGRIGP